MTRPLRVRVVRCVYRLEGDPEWIPMGRSRSRCPRCGAVVGGNDHPLELRSPTPAAGSRPQSTTEEP